MTNNQFPRIVGVRYTEKFIAEALMMYNEGDASAYVTRDQILDQLHRGQTFFTAYQRPDRSWIDVGVATVVDINGTEFIKLASDQEPLDDLGDVPQF